MNFSIFILKSIIKDTGELIRRVDFPPRSFLVWHTVLFFLLYFIASFPIAAKALTMNLHLILSSS